MTSLSYPRPQDVNQMLLTCSRPVWRQSVKSLQFSHRVLKFLFWGFLPSAVFYFFVLSAVRFVLFVKPSPSSCSSSSITALLCWQRLVSPPSSLPRRLVLEIVKRWQKTVCDRRGWERTEGRRGENRRAAKRREKQWRKFGERGLGSVGKEEN